mmetsp:Transcript_107317/g.285542  ORF Transcript_107317/g.285542 Transcript_107317/m.285542 type:complete len:328 (+) Transcript_107317:77-1060(+)
MHSTNGGSPQIPTRAGMDCAAAAWRPPAAASAHLAAGLERVGRPPVERRCRGEAAYARSGRREAAHARRRRDPAQARWTLELGRVSKGVGKLHERVPLGRSRSPGSERVHEVHVVHAAESVLPRQQLEEVDLLWRHLGGHVLHHGSEGLRVQHAEPLLVPSVERLRHARAEAVQELLCPSLQLLHFGRVHRLDQLRLEGQERDLCLVALCKRLHEKHSLLIAEAEMQGGESRLHLRLRQHTLRRLVEWGQGRNPVHLALHELASDARCDDHGPGVRVQLVEAQRGQAAASLHGGKGVHELVRQSLSADRRPVALGQGHVESIGDEGP